MGIMVSINSYSQCSDIFGNLTICPSADDSMVIYNNSLTIYNFYENNKSYNKVSTEDIKTQSDKVSVFKRMIQSREDYLTMLKKHEDYVKKNNLLTGFPDLPYNQYYTEVDEWRYYQRELEFKIINDGAPFPLYDIRLSPIIVNTYKNIDQTSEFYNDEVNIPMYIPVTVKPFSLLTPAEKLQRAEILSRIEEVKKKIEYQKKLSPPIKKVKPIVVIEKDTMVKTITPIIVAKQDTIKVTPNLRIPWDATPIYYHDELGRGCLMGFMIGRKFRKYLPTDEYYSAITNSVKELLNNDAVLEKYLKIRYGGYYDGLYK